MSNSRQGTLGAWVKRQRVDGAETSPAQGVELCGSVASCTNLYCAPVTNYNNCTFASAPVEQEQQQPDPNNRFSLLQQESEAEQQRLQHWICADTLG